MQYRLIYMTVTVALALFCAPAWTSEAAGITLAVLKGHQAVNTVESEAGTSIVVEVRGTDGAPVKGAGVTFFLPEEGPRGVFPGNRSIHSVTTWDDGLALAPGFRPIGVGTFAIEVRAAYDGTVVVATIAQTNVEKADTTRVVAAAEWTRDGSESYRIQILQGDDGVNIINKKTAVKPVVRVVDKNNLPVVAVPVTFIIVAKLKGRSSEFSGGRKSEIVETDATGRAEAPEVQPRGKGAYEIRIQAAVHGQVIGRTIIQTNFANLTAAQRAGKEPNSSAPAEKLPGESVEATKTELAQYPSSSSPPSASPSSGGAGTGRISGAKVGAILGAAALAAGSAAGLAGASQQNQESPARGPACNAGALRSQLQSLLQNKNLACSGFGTDGIYRAWDDLCSCVGTRDPDELKAIIMLNYCVSTTETAAAVANRACRN